VLGIEMDGEILRRDVPQTVVNFCDHRLGFLTDNEQDTRRELMRRAADYLIETALQRLTASRVQKTQLEQQQRKLLLQKANLLKKAQVGLESLAGPATTEPVDLATLEQQLQDLETELGQLRADSATLDKHLAKVAATLSEPEKYLRLEPVALTLDHTNIKVPADSPRVANSMTFEEIVLGKDRRLAALFVRFPSSDLLPQPDFFKEANRLLQSIR
jgi:DNA repair exonuclease SbcCD ATPase subunit